MDDRRQDARDQRHAGRSLWELGQIEVPFVVASKSRRLQSPPVRRLRPVRECRHPGRPQMADPGTARVRAAGLAWQLEALAFFDHVLRGADNGYAEQPPVRYLPDCARWRSEGYCRGAPDFPGPDGRPVRYHLGSRGADAAPRLTTERPDGRQQQLGGVPFGAITPSGLDEVANPILTFEARSRKRPSSPARSSSRSRFSCTEIDSHVIARLSRIGADGTPQPAVARLDPSGLPTRRQPAEHVDRDRDRHRHARAARPRRSPCAALQPHPTPRHLLRPANACASTSPAAPTCYATTSATATSSSTSAGPPVLLAQHDPLRRTQLPRTHPAITTPRPSPDSSQAPGPTSSLHSATTPDSRATRSGQRRTSTPPEAPPPGGKAATTGTVATYPPSYCLRTEAATPPSVAARNSCANTNAGPTATEARNLGFHHRQGARTASHDLLRWQTQGGKRPSPLGWRDHRKAAR